MSMRQTFHGNTRIQTHATPSLFGKRRPLEDHVLAGRAGADPPDGHADKLLDELDVGARLFGEVVLSRLAAPN